MNDMKRLLISICLLPIAAAAQNIKSLSLQQAYGLAQQSYPMVKQKDLVRQTAAITIENLSKGFLPQFSLSGQASYQSAVTEVDVPVPGFTINPHDKDQYKVLADINQLVYDGGVIKEQKNIQQLNEDVEQKKLDVELYKVKDRVGQIFLGILFLDEQLKQVDLIKADLNNGIKRVEAQVNNGVAFKSSLHVLQAELLKAEQRAIELRSSRKGLVDVLSLFINQPLTENVLLEKPEIPIRPSAEEIHRPELKLFSSQNKLLGSQAKLINAKNLPKTSFFLQGGYGKPGLNLFKNDFDFFYIAGVRFNWSFGGLYTQEKEKKLVDVNKKMMDLQKETFLLNTNMSLKQQQSEIDKLQQLINSDQQIIDLRVKVKDAAKAQLENGVITANDFLREVNAEDLSRQTLITHQIQLLQAQINYQTLAGNNK